MDYGFFCDTSAIRSYCHPNDKHKQACDPFFNKYPPYSYDYFVTTKVEQEINNQTFKTNKKPNSLTPNEQTIARYFNKNVKNFLKNYAKCFDIYEYKESNPQHFNSYKQLVIELQSVIKVKKINQSNDIEIISNAFVWSVIISDYDNYCFLTIDWHDFAKPEQKNKIINKAKKCLGNSTNLKINFVPHIQI